MAAQDKRWRRWRHMSACVRGSPDGAQSGLEDAALVDFDGADWRQ